MPDETIAARLFTLEKSIEESVVTLDAIRTDLGISTRIEYANTREIEKLKRHVAKLQHPPDRGPLPVSKSDDDEL